MTTITKRVSPRAKFRRVLGRDSTVNPTIEELIADLTELQAIWNNLLYPLTNELPHTIDDPVDAFTGLGGNTIWSDWQAVSTSGDLFWLTGSGSASGRKNTIKESLLYLDNRLKEMWAELYALISGVEAGDVDLTTIEANIANNTTRIKQVAQDMMGTNYWPLTNGSTGDPTLDNSLGKLLKALLDIHGGTSLLKEYTFPGSALSLSHSIVLPAIEQVDVGESSTYVGDDRTVVAANLEQDMNRLRWELNNIKGVAWNASCTPAYLGGPIDLDGFMALAGSGTKAATNPHGLRWDDITDLTAILGATRDFSGQTNHFDGSPTYTSTVYVSNGDSLETAVGILDDSIDKLSSAVFQTNTIDPVAMDSIDGSPPFGIGTPSYYQGAGTVPYKWTQDTYSLAQQGSEPEHAICRLAIPVGPTGAFPTLAHIFANMVDATGHTADIQMTLIAYDFNGIGKFSPAEDGDSLESANAPKTVAKTWSAPTAHKLEVIDFGTIDVDPAAALGQMCFLIRRDKGDSVNHAVHILSVGVNWYF